MGQSGSILVDAAAWANVEWTGQHAEPFIGVSAKHDAEIDEREGRETDAGPNFPPGWMGTLIGAGWGCSGREEGPNRQPNL